ncbi:MAG: hypothetical protein V1495_08790 [Pseudomonadota bacterium]
MNRQLVVIAVIGLATVATAQPAKHARHRQVRQQERIHQGVKSGELTPEEVRKLEQEQRLVRQAKRAARLDGVVTPEEKQKIHQMQEKTSKDIYDEKHDAEKAPNTP